MVPAYIHHVHHHHIHPLAMAHHHHHHQTAHSTVSSNSATDGSVGGGGGSGRGTPNGFISPTPTPTSVIHGSMADNEGMNVPYVSSPEVTYFIPVTPTSAEFGSVSSPSHDSATVSITATQTSSSSSSPVTKSKPATVPSSVTSSTTVPSSSIASPGGHLIHSPTTVTTVVALPNLEGGYTLAATTPTGGTVPVTTSEYIIFLIVG